MFTGDPSRRFRSAPIYKIQQGSDLNDTIAAIVDPSKRIRVCLKPAARGHCGSEFAGVNKLPLALSAQFAHKHSLVGAD